MDRTERTIEGEGGGSISNEGPAVLPAPLLAEVVVLPAPAPGVKTYEELDGAQGREVYFRSQRYAARELAPLRCTVTVIPAGTPRDCALFDISQSGAAFVWPADVPVKPGLGLRDVTVRFDAHEGYRGFARVTSVREDPQQGAIIAGISFEDFLLDMDDVLQLRNVKGWKAGEELRSASRPWAHSGHHPFKSLVSEFRLYLEDARESLDALEKELPWNVVQGGTASPARTALIARLRGDFACDVVRYTEQIDAALREVPRGEREPMKQFSLRQVHSFLMQSPWMKRAADKPFGYPGDYEVMDFVYERNFEGATLFAKALSLAFLQTKAALAVKFRKDLMKRQLRALIEARTGQKEPLRILSIAAGPAQELVELLRELEEIPMPLEIVLFDQDKSALAYAYKRLKPAIDARRQGKVHVVYLNESIKRLLRDDHLFEQFHQFDAVFSCGLFDYLQPATAVRLTRNLCTAAAPGGVTCIANMVEHPSQWFMEQHLDWHLIYRTREQLLSIGRRAMPDARIRLLEEETGVNPFIELVRD